MNYYNGFSPQQRESKRRALHQVFPGRSHPYFRGACHMCGDPASLVAPHAEDYSKPFKWFRPAVYALCATCHSRVHRRFAAPIAWECYKRHVRRGGYGSDLRVTHVSTELRKLADALKRGERYPLALMRSVVAKRQWWDRLMTTASRPRRPS